jgi:hypothetical protein
VEPGADRGVPAPRLPRPAGWHICHETIYQALFTGTGGLNRQLAGFETDVLAGFVLARSSAGLADARSATTPTTWT